MVRNGAFGCVLCLQAADGQQGPNQGREQVRGKCWFHGFQVLEKVLEKELLASELPNPVFVCPRYWAESSMRLYRSSINSGYCWFIAFLISFEKHSNAKLKKNSLPSSYATQQSPNPSRQALGFHPGIVVLSANHSSKPPFIFHSEFSILHYIFLPA